MITSSRVFAFRFRDRNRKAVPIGATSVRSTRIIRPTWIWSAVDPVLNLYDADWPIRTSTPCCRRPRRYSIKRVRRAKRGAAKRIDSMLCNGCIISGGHVSRSILSPNVRVNSYAIVEDSILYDRVDVGRYARIRRAIIDKDVRIPAHAAIGYDAEHDRQRGFTMTEQGGRRDCQRRRRPRIFSRRNSSDERQAAQLRLDLVLRWW